MRDSRDLARRDRRLADAEPHSGDRPLTAIGAGAWQTDAIHGDCAVTATFDDRIFASGFEP
ncbi:MAG TPA: hypothetical protein VFS55_17640 [Dokdonella sp.]|nr:hypothetical protein [Dokdonella sp.]